MNDDLLKISLKQGKQFNIYQTKIKKNISKPVSTKKRSTKEGFVGFSESIQEQEQIVRPSYDGYVPVLKNMQQSTKFTNNINQQDLDELKKLQTRYNELIQQYTDIQKKIGDSSLATINRLSSNNPYLGKNLLFTNGTIVYVTNQGIAKPYTSKEIFQNNVGKNGCPKDLVKLDISWSSNYIKGETIPTNPSLIVGSNMTIGETCGNEGLNVYVNSLLPNDVPLSYIGCYSASPNNDNMTFIGNKPSIVTVNLINGNFEQPNIANDTYKYINDNNTVPGWGFNAVLLNNSNAWGYPMPYPRGNKCCSIQKTSNIQQNIKLYVNYTYTLTFYSCGRNCCNTPNEGNPINIDLYDQNMKFISNVYKFTPPINKWLNYSTNFTVPTSQIYGIHFIGQTNTLDRSSAIQGINISVGNYSDGNYTYEDCKNSAIENGYQYFALQNVNTTTSKGYCAVSNSEPAITQYGISNVANKMVVLWSSNTAGQPGNTAILSSTGSLQVVDSNGKNVYSSPANNANPNNYYGCYSDASSRAMNLYNNGAHKYDNSQCQQIAIENEYKYYGLQNSTSGKNAQCALSVNLENSMKYGKATNCVKLTDGSWSGGGWSNAIYNALNPTSKYFLILQNDGNMCIYRGTGPNDKQGAIWCSMTNGKQQSANQKMSSLNSKYGKNWISSDSTLASGDFVGSEDGNIALIMQPDGNLVLYTYVMDTNCLKINNSEKIGGGEGANAVYNIGQVAIPKNMGLLGYIDSDSILREYPDSMLGFTNNYQILQNTDSQGNDITSLVTSEQNDCQSACNNNLDCAAYVYQGSSQTCWLKNSSALKKQSNNNVVLGVRQPGLKASSSCSNKISNIDTVRYDNYVKGSSMTKDTRCNDSVVSQSDKIAFDNIKSQLITLGKDIASNMENLYNQDNSIFEKLNTNAEQFKKDLENYKLTNFKISQNLQTNNIEGMKNMNDLNGMLNDTDLRVLQENYSYIMWSILAVGILTITINTMKK
jgi:hypothetical protein